MLRKLVITLAVGGLVLGASACNTVKGIGKDITSVGEAGSKAVK